MTLSICIATRNRADYLQETLARITEAASSRLVEVVIVDGGSSDRTARIVETFREALPLLNYQRRDKPGGVDQDFDLAVGFAQGVYCWLMADDDRVKPGAVDTVLAHLESVAPSLLVANASVYNGDFTQVLITRVLHATEDRSYAVGEDEQFLTDAGAYLTFIGGVVIRRDLWMARDRRSYFGSEFVHVGVIFQSALPAPIAVLADPLVEIRYGNAQWSARSFTIWMFKWPRLIWSLPFSDRAKAAVTPREPWRNLKNLLWYRAKGAYTMKDFRTQLAPEQAPVAWAATAVLIALVPGVVCNILAGIRLRLAPDRNRFALSELAASPFSPRRLFDNFWRERRRRSLA